MTVIGQTGLAQYRARSSVCWEARRHRSGNTGVFPADRQNSGGTKRILGRHRECSGWRRRYAV